MAESCLREFGEEMVGEALGGWNSPRDAAEGLERTGKPEYMLQEADKGLTRLGNGWEKY